jgi:stalled ribosome alternative rescue factor ArfA
MRMKTIKKVKARVSKEGMMGSKSRVHRVKKGKGSYQRKSKHNK